MAILRSNLPRSNARSYVALACFITLTGFQSFGQNHNSCLDCHAALPEPLGVTEETFRQDIHSQKGLSCVSCHGGDAASDDPDKAMSKKAGWKGKIERGKIPELCGTCHSDAAYIRQFNPSLRTDQLGQYHTSIHGKHLAAGDTKVAVCTDCHSVHDVRAPSDPRSTVNPLNVANTCARCHADDKYMASYRIPTDQFFKYTRSVHHQALVVRGDLSAPTCPTCHGNHGAAPPGVDRVENVCSNCHAFQAQMYEKSSHKNAFQSASLPGCVVCHSNHDVAHPSDARLGTGPDGLCMQCHTRGDKCDQARAELLSNLQRLDTAVKRADESLRLAESSGMEVSEARLAQDQAKDWLTKARVTIHSFRPDLMNEDIGAGLKIAQKNLETGEQAMVERNHRRAGLGVSLLAIGMVLVGLRLYIRKIES